MWVSGSRPVLEPTYERSARHECRSDQAPQAWIRQGCRAKPCLCREPCAHRDGYATPATGSAHHGFSIRHSLNALPRLMTLESKVLMAPSSWSHARGEASEKKRP